MELDWTGISYLCDSRHQSLHRHFHLGLNTMEGCILSQLHLTVIARRKMDEQTIIVAWRDDLNDIFDVHRHRSSCV